MSEDLVLHMERLYPPVCYSPSAESLEAHLIYSGYARLTEDLREIFEEQKASAIQLDPEGEVLGEYSPAAHPAFAVAF
ncbi:hypothetical protein [Methylobacterium marchantiae]|uniref:Uncharacterized protein n=1 Tax=Methylobacterium marchantiae TaxID=600331 RepID=A0ABW3X1H0_9HYPH